MPVLDGGDSRPAHIPRLHNTAGFEGRIRGRALVDVMGRQVADVGVEVIRAQVESARHQQLRELR